MVVNSENLETRGSYLNTHIAHIDSAQLSCSITTLTGVVSQHVAQTAVQSNSSMPPYLHTIGHLYYINLVELFLICQNLAVDVSGSCADIVINWSAGTSPCLILCILNVLYQRIESQLEWWAVDTISLEDSCW